MIRKRMVDVGDNVPHDHRVYGNGVEFCERQKVLLLDLDAMPRIRHRLACGNMDLETVALRGFCACDKAEALPVPCKIIVRLDDTDAGFVVDVEFRTTKGDE